MDEDDFNSNSDKSKNSHPEITGIFLIVASIMLLLSLLSYNQIDPSKNWLGQIGYFTSWISLYSFGILSYVGVGVMAWIGWRKLTHKPIEHTVNKIVYITIAAISLGLLLNAFSETHPNIVMHFKNAIFTEKVKLNTTLPHKIVRYNLGGHPLYYLYRDLPKANLLRLLSNIGVSIIFSTTLLTSLLLLFVVSVAPYIVRSQRYLSQKLKAFFRVEQLKKTISLGPKFLFNLPMNFFQWAKDKIKNIFSKKAIDQNYEEVEAETYSTEIVTTPYQRPDAPKEPTFIESQASVRTHPPSPLLLDERNKPSFDKNDYEISPTGRTLTKREKAIIAQKIHNGDFRNYKLPSPNILTPPRHINQPSLKKDLRAQAEVLEATLSSFGIDAKVGEIHCGPSIVSFEVHPATGVKVQKIKALENDIALNLQAKSIRIIAPIPGKAVVGIEIPAPETQEVNFKEILEDYIKTQKRFHIPVLLGKTVSGEHVMTDLARMPHCIIAGATGTGKSVCINAIVMSMLMNCKPDEVKLLLVDPKKVELSPYTSLPHLLAPVITEPEGVVNALKWLVREMEKRYDILKLLGVRNIASFNNRKIDKAFEETLELEIPDQMYYIVCIIDELADLMMLCSNEIEVPIARIAQMARAVGIHLILATQRPSREVITGIIKANFPTRMSFKVASRVNSQIILDEIGAESLLGAGDMLFLPPGAASLIRTQGCFVHDQDVHKVVKNICDQSPPNYLINSFDHMKAPDESVNTSQGPVTLSTNKENLDPLFEQALDLVMKTGSISTTFVQRKLKIGYARAASIMDQLQEEGFITPPDGSKPRKLIMSSRDDELEPEEF